MLPWNVVVTCRRNGERGAVRELRIFGRFHPMGFRDVLVGHVEDRLRFFEDLRKGKEFRDPVWRYVARIVPVDEVFSFSLGTFRERLSEVVDGGPAGFLPALSTCASSGGGTGARSRRRRWTGESSSLTSGRATPPGLTSRNSAPWSR